MITKVEAENASGATLAFFIGGDGSGFTVQSIEGLDPVKADVTSTGFAQLDGAQYQGARRGVRNIVMSVGLEPFSRDMSTVRELRDILYNYFMPKTTVKLRFFEGATVIGRTEGMVESCETSIFSKDPLVTISILCFDPAFYGANPWSQGIATVDIASTEEFELNVLGNLETGYTLTIEADRTHTSGFTLQNRRPDGTIYTMEFEVDVEDGDILVLSTQPNDKFIKLTHAGITESVLWGVTAQSKWAPLYPGPNFLRLRAEGASMPYYVVYTPKYGGL